MNNCIPGWFSTIIWSEPIRIDELRISRDILPHAPGVYTFTNYKGTLEKNTGVLYVGKATSLNKRIQSYLVDPRKMLILSPRSNERRVSSSLRHTGKAMLLVEIQQRFRELGHCDYGIWVRWTQCAAPGTLENQLITYLQPAFNTQLRTFTN
jgi:excinuclease UvrABC nuclease subunit